MALSSLAAPAAYASINVDQAGYGDTIQLIDDSNGDWISDQVDFSEAYITWSDGSSGMLACDEMETYILQCQVYNGVPGNASVSLYSQLNDDYDYVGSFEYVDYGYAKPTVGLTATAGDKSAKIVISFTGSPDPTFTLRRSTASSTCVSGATVLLSNSSKTSYSDSGLSNGTTYYYCVAATNMMGSASAYTSVVPKVVVVAPSAPTLTSAVPTADSVALSWAAPSSTGGAALTGYEIDWSTSNSFSTYSSATVGGSVLTYSPSNLNVGTVYYFRVRAENSAGWGTYSNILSGQTIYASIVGDVADLSVSDGLTPGLIAAASQSFTVATNDPGGLALDASVSSGDLSSGDQTIPAVEGTPDAPTKLAAGVSGWGVRVDGQGKFGTCPGTAIGNDLSALDCSFAALNYSGVRLYSSAAAAPNGTNLTITYGVSSGDNQASGDYSTNVVYTVTQN
ncbi:MAG: fibronectin type III domain-containing protein [Candidatus Nomurabacteria bacterium]|nr:fibronectin type III domain-containing protein [Candidatus Nomurabacteria bacterium]